MRKRRTETNRLLPHHFAPALCYPTKPIYLSAETYIGIIRNLYTYRLKPIYLLRKRSSSLLNSFLYAEETKVWVTRKNHKGNASPLSIIVRLRIEAFTPVKIETYAQMPFFC